MKLYKVQEVEEHCEPVIPDGYSYIIQLENESEVYQYDKLSMGNMELLDEYLLDMVGVSDDDVVYYMAPDEEFDGDYFELDGMVWEQVACENYHESEEV